MSTFKLIIIQFFLSFIVNIYNGDNENEDGNYPETIQFIDELNEESNKYKLIIMIIKYISKSFN